MQWKPYERARLAGQIRTINVSLSGIGDAAADLKLWKPSTKCYELSLELFALERELLELPPKTGAPAPLEELPDSREELPF